MRNNLIGFFFKKKSYLAFNVIFIQITAFINIKIIQVLKKTRFTNIINKLMQKHETCNKHNKTNLKITQEIF